ncbi:MAG TPA: hypothetical protein VD948_06940, partial [Rhodothermales bacterium]|nr:hypothetical protein [Rhodothermales bacterium]
GGDGPYTGVVYAVEPGIEQTTRALTVRARVGNPGNVLTPGAFAEVQLVLERVEDALVVPTASVVPGVDSAAVYVVREGKAVRRPVRTGIRTPDRVQVLGRVAVGDTVLTSGVDQVRPGQSVRVAGAGRGEGRESQAPGGVRRDSTSPDTSRRTAGRQVGTLQTPAPH